jgi:hypothetical protein
MAVPLAPFCTTTEVAQFNAASLNQKTDYQDGVTVPGKTAVTQFILLISNQILMRFRSAGYKVPFVAMSGEEWPDDQTEFLKLITIMGVTGFIAGPAVGNPGVRASKQNEYTTAFNAQLDEIYTKRDNICMPWRAQYYSRTPAEKAVGEATLPSTDFLNQMFDPTRYSGLYPMADKLHSIQTIMSSLNLDWDYNNQLNSLNRGLGRYQDES